MLSLQELISLARELGDEHVLSVYLDAAFDDPARRASWRVPVDNSIKNIRRDLEGSSHEERKGFEHCVELLDNELASFAGGVGAAGWVGFITVHGVRLAEKLPAPMPTLVIWRTGICIAPYIRALKQSRPVVVIVADASAARLYRYATGLLGSAETVHAHAVIEAPVHMGDAPRLGFHAGTRGETGRDASQAARLVGTDRMLEEVTRQGVKIAGHDGWILVGGIPEVSAHIAHAVERLAPDRVLRLNALDIHATDAQVHAAAERGASQLRDEMDLRHVSEITGGADDQRLIARGLTATQHALEQASVRELYLTPRFMADHLADAESSVRAAMAQDAVIEEVSRAAADRLDEFGGIGARLRYALPA